MFDQGSSGYGDVGFGLLNKRRVRILDVLGIQHCRVDKLRSYWIFLLSQYLVHISFFSRRIFQS
jgi:hypothetical protein